MALKVQGNTVIDDSLNVTQGTPLVDAETVISTSEFVIPSGNTAARPAAPATGMLFFDTDEGKIVVYDGSEWI